MRFRPAPLSFWANVITVGLFCLPILFFWLGYTHPFPLALLFYLLAAVLAVLVVLCWGISSREYRVEGTTLVIVSHLGVSKSYEILAIDEIAMKRQPLRRAFAFQALGAYGPFGFHGRYRAIVTRPSETAGGTASTASGAVPGGLHHSAAGHLPADESWARCGFAATNARDVSGVRREVGGERGELKGEGGER